MLKSYIQRKIKKKKNSYYVLAIKLSTFMLFHINLSWSTIQAQNPS